MNRSQHALRVGLLMAGAAILLGWVIRHTEASFADGLRYIHRAERIQATPFAAGSFRAIDHPLHPLGIAVIHKLLGGTDPASWQLAALLLCLTSAVLLVVPVYLLTLELFGEQAAWMASVLVVVNPIIGYVVVNVLSESTFLLWWTFGLWGAVRFFREGRFVWLPLAIGFGALAYSDASRGHALTRGPAGDALGPAQSCERRASTGHGGGRPWLFSWLAWSSWSDRTSRSRVVWAPSRASRASWGWRPVRNRWRLERERPLPDGQTALETYRIATVRMAKVFRAAVTPPAVPVRPARAGASRDA